MATVKLLTDEEADPQARAVFDDIRKTRSTDYVNNSWRALANDPANLKASWEKAKQVMGPGTALDPLVKEFTNFILSQEGQEVVVKDGYLPLSPEIVKQELAKLQ